MSKYLVTGGAGFIGSNIVETLVHRGERVRVLDNFSTGKPQNLAALDWQRTSEEVRDTKPSVSEANSIEFIKGDIRNLEQVREAVKGVDYVFHQADISKAQTILGYEPKVDLTVGLMKTIDWFRSGAKETEFFGKTRFLSSILHLFFT